MENYKKYCCNRKTKIVDLLRLLEQTHRKTVIVEEGGRLCGIITDGDVRRHLLASNDMLAEAEQIMNKTPVYLYEDEIDQAHHCMNKNLIDAVPILNKKGFLCDVVFRYDAFLEAEKKEVINIPVVIMAGGKGTRLMPYTGILPKPLMPMKSKTVIECIMESFYENGCRNFFLILNYKKEIIKAYFKEVSNPYSIEYIEEEDYMGTGGGLYYLKDKVHSTFIVSNCDVLLNFDYAEALKQHRRDGNVMTIIAAEQNFNIPYGVIQAGPDGVIEKLQEKPELNFIVNTGVYILEPDVIKDMSAQSYDMTDIIDTMIFLKKRVGTYVINESDWIDVGEMVGLTQNIK